MSPTTTSPKLYPVPPPTTNTLPASQRTRLQKSSRKLEAVLGATPYVLEVDVARSNALSFLDFDVTNSDQQSYARPPITPRTRARRRRGQVFGPSSSSCSDESSSCSSSGSDDETVVEDDRKSDAGSFIFVNPSTPYGRYQPHSLPDAVSPTRTHSRSKSEAVPKSKSKSKTLPAPPLTSRVAPIHVDLPLPGSGKSSKKSGPQPLAQPVLLRLRALPPRPTHQKSSSVSTLNSISGEQPRTPLSAAFNPQPKTEAQEKEIRRKKLAKLARTLGENVPPELVFGSPVTDNATNKGRRPSISRPKRTGPTKPSLAAHVKAISVSAPTTASISPADAAPAKKFKRAHRPRSLSVPAVAFPPKIDVEVEVEQAEDDEISPMVFTTPATPIVDRYEPVHISPVQTEPKAPLPASTSYYSSNAKATSTAPYTRRIANSLESPRGRVAFEGLVALPHASRSASALGNYSSRSTSATHLALPYSPSGRGAASLDIERPQGNLPFTHAHSASVHANYGRSPMDYVYGGKTGGAKSASAAVESEDLHRRKEREWSGEWNVSDMGDVVRRLRELRGR
ncbi:hypothetical protein FA15DRAFT_652388 [Coprinopsis marcescibilis]|uniref:Uncharacterized protein n=1 Tax=Coprinopsis marcescibilis TaxID=230819 RepID=A0A5C3L8D4_COPMA|nr:hypothetical protein FA15DRAFT_652388 [Coprinopsis marcescibilis]